MKIIYNKYIPFKGFYAINLFGTLFIREEYKNRPIQEYTFMHELIHTCQANDFCIWKLGYIPFYILYFLEYLIKLLITFNPNIAYKSISFEQEAYKHEHIKNYNKTRSKFNWLKYIFKMY